MREGKEWLETDSVGGFCCGSEDLIPRRKYHSFLTVATKPPLGRITLVNAVEVIVKVVRHTGEMNSYSLNSFRFPGNILHPKGVKLLKGFRHDLWPRWTYAVEGFELEFELLMPKHFPMTLLRWRRKGRGPLPKDASSVIIQVRPFLSCRDYHSLHKKNPYFSFHTQKTTKGVVWRPYPSTPEVAVLTRSEYVHDPLWYHDVTYDFETARGYDDTEDLASPGYFWSALSSKGTSLGFAAPEYMPDSTLLDRGPATLISKFFTEERERRKAFPTPYHRAADAYIVKRREGKSIMAGYPWFSDWGRDAFIALRGLCLSTKRFEDAKEILLEWKRAISYGMIPNLFPEDADSRPLYNSVDASLWFVVSAFDYLKCVGSNGVEVAEIIAAVGEIIEGYSAGTRFGIICDGDGLLKGGISGTQLTWMDAKVGSIVMTPRVGKPVELQALWINSLLIAEELGLPVRILREQAFSSFQQRFWNESQGQLFDVIDVNHVAGTSDPSCRPNQILAVGGLPYQIMTGQKARRMVDTMEKFLYTPQGIRTLSPADRRYRPLYRGQHVERDRAYHNGTAWPWLLGPFIEAWVRVRGSTEEALKEATSRFLLPLQQSSAVTADSHIHEICDGAFPHHPRGCPFQAWSLAEMMRIQDLLGVQTFQRGEKKKSRKRQKRSASRQKPKLRLVR